MLLLARVLNVGQVGQCFLEKNLDGTNLSRLEVNAAKGMIRKTIYQLTGLDFGARFVVVPDLMNARCHVWLSWS